MSLNRAPRYSVVIRVGAQCESYERALKSVLRIHKQVHEVYIVSKYITKDTSSFSTLPDVLRTLRDEHAIHVHYVEELDYSTLKTHCVMELPSTVQIKDTDGRLQREIQRHYQKLTKYQRFAYNVKYDFSSSDFSIWYLVMCVVFVLDWWRSLFASFTFHTAQQVRFVEIQGGASRKYVAPHYTPWITCCGYWAHGDRRSIAAGHNKCITGPQKDLQGYHYFMYWMQQRDGVSGNGWRLWYALCLLFYHINGIAWYGPLVIWALKSVLPVAIPKNALYALDPFSTTRISLFLVLALVHWIILRANFKWRFAVNNVIISMLMPFAVPLVIPFLLIWAKLKTARREYVETLDDDDDHDKTIQYNELDKH